MLKKLFLYNIGEIGLCDYTFDNGLNIIETSHGDTLAYALGYVTGNFSLCKAFPTLLNPNSRISAKLFLDKDYTFDTLDSSQNEKISSLLFQSREEDNFCFYKSGKYNHKVKLAEYKDFERFYLKCQFAKETDGACLSRTFRAYLTTYIRNFKPQKLNPKKNFYININDLGEFFVEGNPDLSASEKTLFDFLCFLNITEFWEGFEKIKDLNHIKKPIVITELFEMIDESIPKAFIMKRLKKLNRQIFLIERK